MPAIIPAGYEVRDEAGNLVAVAVRDIAIYKNTVVILCGADFVNYAGVPFEAGTLMPRAVDEFRRRLARGEPITSPLPADAAE